jgi:serine peptidase DegS
MPDSSLPRNTFFIAGSVLAGLLIAMLVMRLFPQVILKDMPDTRTASQVPQPVAGAMDIHAVVNSGAGPVGGTALAESSFAPAVRASAPAVVSIYTRSVEAVPAASREQMFSIPGRAVVEQKLGSGVIADSLGHIVTNNHVIAGSEEIAVQLADGRTAAAKLVGSDPDTDLALLLIDLPRLPVMKFGRSDRVAVGDVVLAIGNPFGRLAQTVTHGIVSAKGRADLGVATYEDFIQTDAAINDGNSGGALVNTRGELVGINTAVLGKERGAEGLGIAIPVDLVRGVMDDILRHGRVIRGWIGIATADVSAGLARRYGLPHAGVTIQVYQDSPAADAGLRNYDMVLGIDDAEAKGAQDVAARIAGHKPGSTVHLVVERGARQMKLAIRVVEVPQAPPQ